MCVMCGSEDIDDTFQRMKDEGASNFYFPQKLCSLSVSLSLSLSSFVELLCLGIIQTNVCGAIWEEGETVYKCSTCEMDNACAICLECFTAGTHHHIYLTIPLQSSLSLSLSIYLSIYL